MPVTLCISRGQRKAMYLRDLPVRTLFVPVSGEDDLFYKNAEGFVVAMPDGEPVIYSDDALVCRVESIQANVITAEVSTTSKALAYRAALRCSGEDVTEDLKTNAKAAGMYDQAFSNANSAAAKPAIDLMAMQESALEIQKEL